MSDLQRSSPTIPATRDFEPFDPGRPQYKLYSLAAIDLATFLGSLVAGSLLLAANFRNLGNHDSSRNAIVLGLTAFAAFAFAIFHLPPALEELPAGPFYLLQVAAAHMYGKWKQGEALDRHQDVMGSFHSKWRAAGIGLLATPLALGIMLLAGVAGVLTEPKPENVEVAVDWPTAVEREVRFEIQVHVYNTAAIEQTLVTLGADEYLKGIVIESSDPPFSEFGHIPLASGTSYSYDLAIPPGREISITLFAYAAHRGDYAGEFHLCINSTTSCLYYSVRTIVE